MSGTGSSGGKTTAKAPRKRREIMNAETQSFREDRKKAESDAIGYPSSPNRCASALKIFPRPFLASLRLAGCFLSQIADRSIFHKSHGGLGKGRAPGARLFSALTMARPAVITRCEK
jgi:hypothetical protein